MVAYDSDIEDFEIDEETILDREINLKFNEYISEGIEVNPTKEFLVDELDYIDKHLTESPLLHNAELPDIKFIDEITLQKLLVRQTINTVRTVVKNTRRQSFWTNTNFCAFLKFYMVTMQLAIHS